MVVPMQVVPMQTMVAALRAPSVGENDIAMDIEERYMSIRSPPSSPQFITETGISIIQIVLT